MKAAVDGELGQVESDDPVERRNGVGAQLVERTSIHSSRRARTVVSDTRCSRIAWMSTHDDPVVSRIRMPHKQSRSATLGR